MQSCNAENFPEGLIEAISSPLVSKLFWSIKMNIFTWLHWSKEHHQECSTGIKEIANLYMTNNPLWNRALQNWPKYLFSITWNERLSQEIRRKVFTDIMSENSFLKHFWCLLQPQISPSSGLKLEDRFNTLLHWLHISSPESTFMCYSKHIIMDFKMLFDFCMYQTTFIWPQHNETGNSVFGVPTEYF